MPSLTGFFGDDKKLSYIEQGGRMKRISFWTIGLILFGFSLSGFSQTSPKAFLGHEVGVDRKLADYDQIQAYFHKLDEESDKIQVINIGKSVEGKPMLMAIISSTENMGKLDEYRAITKKLRDARGTSPEQAERLAAEGKILLLITCSLHATEIAASQMSMELAYDLVTGNTPYDSESVLKDVIVLLCPTINPDGEQMVTEWYRKYVGTSYEGTSMPWLYQHYAGHDNNRDWFMFNLPETRAVNKVLYHDWIPQIHIDEHQMGSTGARLFVPPFMDPPIPTVHPLVWRGVGLCGMSMSYDMQKNGHKGVVHGRSFTGWWIGACDDTSWLHNTLGILSEMASVKTASPIYIEPTEIPNAYVEKRMQFPDPWLGGWWRLRDIVEYELTLSKSLIKTAGLHKNDFLMNFYRMCREAVDIQSEGQPFAFVIPPRQHDPLTMRKMLQILEMGGVELQQAHEDFSADGKLYPAGSTVVLMSQPYRPYAQALLEKQKYPDLRQYPGGPPVPPYDNAGWTLPLQMGVTCERIDRPFKAKLSPLSLNSFASAAAPEPDAAFFLIDSRINAAYTAAFALLNAKVQIHRSRETVHIDDYTAAPGSFVIKNTPEALSLLSGLVKKLDLPVHSLPDIEGLKITPLKRHRVGVYQSWKANMDEGWTRYVLDDLDIPFTTLHNQDFQSKGKNKIDLKENFDVIVFADEAAEIIKDGKPSPTSPYASRYTEGPPEYRGGIGKAGIDGLKDFVAQGGICITLNNACGLIFKEFKPPVTDSLERVDRSKFFCPTSILRINVNNRSPIGYGMPEKASAVFSRSLGLSTRIPSGDWDRTVVASYPNDDVLDSGWLLGEEFIARKAAVVDTRYKKGHFILIGFRCQHRAQSHGTYKFLLNALLYPETD